MTLAVFLNSCTKDDLTVQSTEANIESKADRSDVNSEYSPLGSKYSKNEAREYFSKALAITMANDPEVKNYLIEKANEQFNGDYEVLYLMVKDEKLNNGTFAEILQTHYERNYRDELPRDFFSEEVVKADPYLTVYIDEHYYEESGLFTRPVSVIYENSGIDESDVSYYDGFSAEGEPIKVTSFDRDDVVIGIKENERLIIVDKRSMTSLNGNKIGSAIYFPLAQICAELIDTILIKSEQALITGDEVLIIDVLQLNNWYKCLCLNDCKILDSDGDGVPNKLDDCPLEAGLPSNNGCPESVPQGCVSPAGCDRTNRSAKNEIYNIRFNNCSTFSSVYGLLEGKLEMRASISYAYFNPNTSKAETTSILKAASIPADAFRDDNWIGSCTGTKWYDAFWETITWDYCTYGDQAYIYWYEEDNADFNGSIKVGFKLKITKEVEIPVEVNIPLNNADDKLGGSVVQFCDTAEGAGYKYNTGSLEFHYRMRP